jgi:LPPG:FO 2-phospho-L-lactate transferase
MSDDPVRTVVVTDEGRLPFQEFLVVHRARAAVRAVEHDGLAAARPAPAVLPALRGADLVILAPSSPVASLGPILALPGVRAALAAARVVAVTPVVSGRAPATPPEQSRARVRAAFLASAGLDHTATAVAALYAGLADTFVLDERDASESAAIEGLGMSVVQADTLATGRGRITLAECVLAAFPPRP